MTYGPLISAQKTRQNIPATLSIGYGDDIKKAKELIAGQNPDSAIPEQAPSQYHANHGFPHARK
jgi:hypothetical protein